MNKAADSIVLNGVEIGDSAIVARFMSQLEWTPEGINEAIHEIDRDETAHLNTLKIIGGELP